MREIDWYAYQEGREASIKVDSDVNKAENPYQPHSIKWISWNRGWNSHYDERWESGGK